MPGSEIIPDTSGCGEAFKRLYDVVARLRAPGGCPWDREQNPKTLRGDLIEETYECVEAVDEGDPDHIREELGDLFLLVTMLSYMHEQENSFTVAEVLDTLREKLIRRHPHVFGEAKAQDGAELTSKEVTSEEVLRNWVRIKVEQEGRRPKDSILDEVSKGLPPMDRSYKLQKKAAKAGFDFLELKGVCAKIREELEEAEKELERGETAAEAALETELGDLLFSVVNLCRYVKIEPSVALQRSNNKFTERFKHVEKRMKEAGMEMKRENLALMDKFWDEAKTVFNAG
ncbi:MAG: nucleoside triphosphate pyrophosphohydrolase [Treponema sp.]|jgi:tetrapyrrole methylase family protein/MazG family protein|nr:nucleoside triphosphate pyrophosphohydrolase [Treponema sp.]